MIIERILREKIIELLTKLPVVSITGPRQSGKTTLVKYLLHEYKYVSLENPSSLNFALNDPTGFLRTYGDKLIIDEAQKAPELFSYIQTIVDEKNQNGLYVLTGSQNFLLSEKISQSLAGRVAIFYLLPFSYDEIKETEFNINELWSLLIKGFYPRVYNSNLDPAQWYNDYIQTYIERDVRQITNVGDLNTFRKFISICAARCGQIINLSSIANDIGISYHTVRKWISIMEQSFIIFTLKPFHENYNKRLIKSPKIYFYDTGLLCALLNIKDEITLGTHPNKGSIFESFIISELYKNKYNLAQLKDFYFFRDQTGNEVDCLQKDGLHIKAIEIKSTETIKSELFKGLHYWNALDNKHKKSLFLVYSGNENQFRENLTIISWKNLTKYFA